MDPSKKIVLSSGKNTITKSYKAVKKAKKFVAPLKASLKASEVTNIKDDSNQSQKAIQTNLMNKTYQVPLNSDPKHTQTSQQSDQNLTSQASQNMKQHLTQTESQTRQITGHFLTPTKANETSQLGQSLTPTRPISQYLNQSNYDFNFDETFESLHLNNSISQDIFISQVNVANQHPVKFNDENFLLSPTDTEMHGYDSSQNTTRTKNKTDLGGILFGSLNLLNNEEIDYSQETLTQSDNLSIQMLSRNQSHCSVVSLKKYKDLDYNSNDNIVIQPNNMHTIPRGKDFYKLFDTLLSNNYVKSVAMDTNLGDMGFNVKYTDYIKSVGFDAETNNEANETYEKMLQMYPEENKKISDKKIN